MKKFCIDLNLDAGESLLALEDGSEEKLFALVSSVNIACGGHTGDETTMALAVSLAKKYKLNVGAHPSFPDRENFGRQIVSMEKSLLVESMMDQVKQLKKICDDQQVAMTHLKLHGALYNLAANDFETASALIAVVTELPYPLKVVTLAESKSVRWLKAAGIEVLSEGFVDRRYEVDGTLRMRKFSDALISNPVEAAEQALKISTEGRVFAFSGVEVPLFAETLCIHGDTMSAHDVAMEVRRRLELANIAIQAYRI